MCQAYPQAELTPERVEQIYQWHRNRFQSRPGRKALADLPLPTLQGPLPAQEDDPHGGRYYMTGVKFEDYPPELAAFFEQYGLRAVRHYNGMLRWYETPETLTRAELFARLYQQSGTLADLGPLETDLPKAKRATANLQRQPGVVDRLERQVGEAVYTNDQLAALYGRLASALAGFPVRVELQTAAKEAAAMTEAEYDPQRRTLRAVAAALPNATAAENLMITRAGIEHALGHLLYTNYEWLRRAQAVGQRERPTGGEAPEERALSAAGRANVLPVFLALEDARMERELLTHNPGIVNEFYVAARWRHATGPELTAAARPFWNSVPPASGKRPTPAEVTAVAAVEPLVMAAMQQAPEDRYTTALTIAERLAQAGVRLSPPPHVPAPPAGTPMAQPPSQGGPGAPSQGNTPTQQKNGATPPPQPAAPPKNGQATTAPKPPAPKKGKGEHCPDCGGFLDANGACNNPDCPGKQPQPNQAQPGEQPQEPDQAEATAPEVGEGEEAPEAGEPEAGGMGEEGETGTGESDAGESDTNAEPGETDEPEAGDDLPAEDDGMGDSANTGPGEPEGDSAAGDARGGEGADEAGAAGEPDGGDAGTDGEGEALAEGEAANAGDDAEDGDAGAEAGQAGTPGASGTGDDGPDEATEADEDDGSASPQPGGKQAAGEDAEAEADDEAEAFGDEGGNATSADGEGDGEAGEAESTDGAAEAADQPASQQREGAGVEAPRQPGKPASRQEQRAPGTIAGDGAEAETGEGGVEGTGQAASPAPAGRAHQSPPAQSAPSLPDTSAANDVAETEAGEGEADGAQATAGQPDKEQKSSAAAETGQEGQANSTEAAASDSEAEGEPMNEGGEAEAGEGDDTDDGELKAVAPQAPTQPNPPQSSAAPASQSASGASATGQQRTVGPSAEPWEAADPAAIEAALRQFEAEAAPLIEADLRRQTSFEALGEELHAPLPRADGSRYQFDTRTYRVRDLATDKLTTVNANMQAAPAYAAGIKPEWRANVRRVATRVAAELDDIRAAVRRHRERFLEEGRFDRRRIVAAYKGDENIRYQNHAIEDTAVAASIVVDMSASMAQAVSKGWLYQATAAISSAMTTLNMAHEVRAFGTQNVAVKAMEDERLEDQRGGALGVLSLGGTQMRESITLAGNSLLGRPEKNRVIFCLTDGALDDHTQTRAQLTAAREQGVLAFGVFYGRPAAHTAQALTDLYGRTRGQLNWVAITDLTEFPRAVARRLADIFNNLADAE
jgi:hypothetical protein